MDDASRRIWTDIAASGRRSMHFSLHTANWELAAQTKIVRPSAGWNRDCQTAGTPQ